MPTAVVNTLTTLLGIELPFVQAPMAGVQNSKLAIAVSNAGGLGSLPCAMLSDEGIETELKAIKQNTDKPYNLNFFCHTPPAIDNAAETAWRNLLLPYYTELGLDITSIKAGPARKPFTSSTADLIEKFTPPIISFHFGLPEADLVDRIKSWGAKILASATTLEEALWLEANGADVIIAQGVEAGGHRGMFLSGNIEEQLPLDELLLAIRSNIATPIVAAGGIGCAADLRRAMANGASGAQIGTAFLLCPETDTSEVHRRALKNQQNLATALTNVFSGRPARSIINRVMRELGPMSKLAPNFPLAATAIGPLRSQAEQNLSSDFSPLWAGENYQHCREIPAKQVLTELAKGLAKAS